VADVAVRPWGVRYIVRDLDRAIEFYTERLGFTLDHRAGGAFAKVSCETLGVLLSGPGSSGARPLPDGREQPPGGFNRIVLRVDDLDAAIEKMKRAGVAFRNEMEVGPGGRQIQIEDPDGNPVELFEPERRPPA
jgi:glyoxylase I family protein